MILHAMKVNDDPGASLLTSLRHRAWIQGTGNEKHSTHDMAETVTAFLIEVIGSRVNWAERRQGTYCRLRNRAAVVAGQ